MLLNCRVACCSRLKPKSSICNISPADAWSIAGRLVSKMNQNLTVRGGISIKVTVNLIERWENLIGRCCGVLEVHLGNEPRIKFNGGNHGKGRQGSRARQATRIILPSVAVVGSKLSLPPMTIGTISNCLKMCGGLDAGISVWAYSLMPNHVNLVIVPDTVQSLSWFLYLIAILTANGRYRD